MVFVLILRIFVISVVIFLKSIIQSNINEKRKISSFDK